MSIGVSPYNPLDYLGPNVGLIPIRFICKVPTTSDKKFPVGQMLLIEKNPISGTQGDLYYLSKFDSSGDPVWIQLLSGAASPGIDSVETDDGAPDVEPDINGGIQILGGTGISVTGQGPGNTVTITSTGTDLNWTSVTSATQAVAIKAGYFANRGAGVAFTLPATANLGESFAISAINAGGWSLAQNAGQTIHLGSTSSTMGVGGSLASTEIGDTITVVCRTQDTDFQVVSSMGNITVV